MTTITLENLEIATEYVRWCRSRGLTYQQIMGQFGVSPGGYASPRRCVLAAARLNAMDQECLRWKGEYIAYATAA
jgi:hypothetical protein